MIEKMGSTKYVLPAIAVVLIGCVMALMFTPMLKMAPKELPFAVLSLDTGMTTPQGEVNAGELMADKIVGAGAIDDGEAAPIAWRRIKTQQELDAALANNDYYGALTIPADFTKGQALAQTAQGTAPSVQVVLDNAKSPLMAAQMQSTIGAMFEQMGIPIDIELIHIGDTDSTSVSPMAGMMSQQIGIMPLMMMSMIGSILLTRSFPRKQTSTTNARFAVLGRQLTYALGISLMAALMTVWLLNWLVGAQAPFWTTTVFLWFASFAVMSLLLGAFNVSVLLGALVALGALICGMSTAVLPREILPAFWADWIYPWVPQPFIAGGLRDILYMGADLMPRGSVGLLGLGGGGLVLLLVSGFIPTRTPKNSAGAEMASRDTAAASA